jgi:hypothetical protein
MMDERLTDGSIFYVKICSPVLSLKEKINRWEDERLTEVKMEG